MKQMTQKDLNHILDEHPLLSNYGYGDIRRFYPDSKKSHEQKRELLRGSLKEARSAVLWLTENCRRARGYEHSSYGLKHYPQNACHRDSGGCWGNPCSDGHHGYYTNGVFIAALLFLGYRMRVEIGNPNPTFMARLNAK